MIIYFDYKNEGNRVVWHNLFFSGVFVDAEPMSVRRPNKRRQAFVLTSAPETSISPSSQ